MPEQDWDLDDLFPEENEELEDQIGRHRRKEELETTSTLPNYDPHDRVVELPPEDHAAKAERLREKLAQIEVRNREEDREPTPQELVRDAALRARQAEIQPHPPSPSMPGVKEITMSQPMDLQSADPRAKGPWIQYNGVATVRIITRHDWAQAGVQSEKYCEWNYLNAKRLPRSMFTDDELQYLLRVDGRFSLER